MGKLVYILLFGLIANCSNTTYHTMTGHGKQSEQIERTFQHALEYNPDGMVAYWHDKNTGKSGSVTPLYASYKFKGPCRHFEIAYFSPTKYYHGIACRRDQVWQIH